MNRTACIKGHPFAGQNLVIEHRNGRPRRACRKCMRARWTRLAEQRRAAR